MSLRGLSRAGALALAAVAIYAFVGVASAAGGSGVSTRRYPAALPSRGGALKACPSPAGLEAFDARARRQARREALAYNRAGLAGALADSDRAWQPTVRALWRSGAPRREAEVVRAVTAAGRSPYRVIVSYSCGGRLIRRSLVVALAPAQPAGEPHCEACVENFFLVDRRGRALIYFIY